jgi:hypothetical protein
MTSGSLGIFPTMNKKRSQKQIDRNVSPANDRERQSSERTALQYVTLWRWLSS